MSVSVNIDLELEGTRQLIQDMSAMSLRRKGAVIRILDETALNVQRKAKRFCPVDTGRLRSSIAIRRTGLMSRDIGAGVSSNVEYAWEVEFGTGTRGQLTAQQIGIERNFPRFEEMPEGQLGGLASGSFGALSTPAQIEYGTLSGQRAQPYMTPAWQSEKPKFVRKIKGVFDS